MDTVSAGINGIVDHDLDSAMRIWRRDLHRHPEMAFNEERTASLVAAALSSFGLEVHANIARTGVVGILDFGEGPSIGLRADMDALPIMEQTGVAYASAFPGCMHACGHDGHTAMLLGAAKILAQRRDLSGRIVFIFQPAEENEGGARAMMEAGLFDRFPIDAIFGLHNMPGVPVGTFMARPGTITTAYNTFSITIEGKGGHGAMPETAKDPIVAGAALVLALQTIVSRNARPLDTVVLTVGQITGGDTFNVIPDRVYLKGSCRSLTPATLDLVRQRIEAVCQGTADTYGVCITCLQEERYPAIVNTKAESELVIAALRGIEGAGPVITDFPPSMGSEDFSFYLQKRPGCYFIIGNGEGGGSLHSPTYDFNDDALKFGAAAWVAIAEKGLTAALGAVA